MARTTSLLSEIVGQDDPSAAAAAAGENNYEILRFFRDEPDAAIVAKAASGRCYGIFRYTTASLQDIQQNGGKGGAKDICSDDNSDECCKVRMGWWEAYNAPFRDEFEQALRDCVASSSTCKDDCVVLGGFSQGAAIAAVASIYLADLNPMVMLLGQPITLYPDCKAIDSSRWYRFINTGVCSGIGGILVRRVVYDWSVFRSAPGDEIPYGHMILLSDDDTGVAYLGLDARMEFSSRIRLLFATSHILRERRLCSIPGYIDRLKALLSQYSDGGLSYPIRGTGYKIGTYCTKDVECESKDCRRSELLFRGKCMN